MPKLSYVVFKPYNETCITVYNHSDTQGMGIAHDANERIRSLGRQDSVFRATEDQIFSIAETYNHNFFEYSHADKDQEKMSSAEFRSTLDELPAAGTPKWKITVSESPTGAISLEGYSNSYVTAEDLASMDDGDDLYFPTEFGLKLRGDWDEAKRILQD